MAPSNQSGEKDPGAATAAPKAKVERVAPVVVNLGKAKKKRIKQLKRGDGKLMNKVAKALLEIEQQMGDRLDGKTVLPVVMVVERDPSGDGLSWWHMR